MGSFEHFPGASLELPSSIISVSQEARIMSVSHTCLAIILKNFKLLITYTVALHSLSSTPSSLTQGNISQKQMRKIPLYLYFIDPAIE
jgi:hypothetical protein